MVNRGDVIYVKCDENDTSMMKAGEIPKKRPLLVVSNDVGNMHSNVVLAVPMTTKQKAMYMPTHCVIGRGSTVLCEQIYTVPQDEIACVSWRASRYDMAIVDECLKASLGLLRCCTGDTCRPRARSA